MPSVALCSGLKQHVQHVQHTWNNLFPINGKYQNSRVQASSRRGTSFSASGSGAEKIQVCIGKERRAGDSCRLPAGRPATGQPDRQRCRGAFFSVCASELLNGGQQGVALLLHPGLQQCQLAVACAAQGGLVSTCPFWATVAGGHVQADALQARRAPKRPCMEVCGRIHQSILPRLRRHGKFSWWGGP